MQLRPGEVTDYGNDIKYSLTPGKMISCYHRLSQAPKRHEIRLANYAFHTCVNPIPLGMLFSHVYSWMCKSLDGGE